MVDKANVRIAFINTISTTELVKVDLVCNNKKMSFDVTIEDGRYIRSMPAQGEHRKWDELLEEEMMEIKEVIRKHFE